MNTVTASFNTTMRQMTEMFQRTKQPAIVFIFKMDSIKGRLKSWWDTAVFDI